MRFVILLTCMFLLANVKFLYAQDNQIKVRVFDGTEPEESTQTKNRYNQKNFIHINPYLLVRGAFTVGYERALHEKHSVLIDVGLTYRDYLYEFTSEDDLLFGDENSKVEIGRYFQVAYKFYPKGIDDFDGGFYISPAAIVRNYKVSEDIEISNSNGFSDATFNRSYSMNEFALKFGYCTESWLFDDVISDIYFGIGSREISYKQYSDQNDPLSVENVKEKKPALYFGIKVGFVF